MLLSCCIDLVNFADFWAFNVLLGSLVVLLPKIAPPWDFYNEELLKILLKDFLNFVKKEVENF